MFSEGKISYSKVRAMTRVATPKNEDSLLQRSRGNVGKVIRSNLRNGLEITPKTSTPRWYGEKMDHELAVLSLVQKE